MKQLFKLLLLIFFISCGQNVKQPGQSVDDLAEHYKTFDEDNHLLPLVDKTKFDTTHGWNFGWTILEPINIAKGEDDEKTLAKRFSPGQKALYFIWYLDAEVTNGGFIQFYWNGYRKYLPPIIDGLKLINDTSMFELVNKADQEYLINKKKFDLHKQKGNWEPLYEELKKFDELDSVYYAVHDKTMALIEKYVRQNHGDFVKFR